MRITLFRSLLVGGILVGSLLAGCGSKEPAPPASPVPIPSLDEETILPEAIERCENAFVSPISGGSPVDHPLYLRSIGYESDDEWKIVDYPHQAVQDRDLGFLVCIQETRVAEGSYTDGAEGYRRDWTVRMVDWVEGTVMTEEVFQGLSSPEIKSFEGDAYGKRPYDDLMTWLATNQPGDLAFIYVAEEISDLELSGDGNTAAYCGDGHLSIFEIETLKIEADLSRDEPILSLDISPDGEKVAFSTPTKFSIMEVESMETVAELDVGLGHITFSPSGNFLATADENNLIVMWDMEVNEILGTIVPHRGRKILSLIFSQDGQLLASSGEDNFIRLWDTATGKQVFEFEYEKEPRILALSPDSDLLASKADSSPLVIWNTETMEEAARFEDPGFWVFSVAFSPDGEHIAFSGDDYSRSVWNHVTGEEIRRLSGFVDRGGRAGSLAYSPDGALLAGISDKVVRLWDTATWEELPPLTGHTDDVKSITFAEGGRYLATTSLDNTIRIWDLSQ
jgi:hypothetical protein